MNKKDNEQEKEGVLCCCDWAAPQTISKRGYHIERSVCVVGRDASVVECATSTSPAPVAVVEAAGIVAVVGEAGFSVTVAGISALPLGLIPRALVRTPKVSPSRAVSRLLLRVSNSSLALLPLSSRTRRRASRRSSGVACCMRRGFRTSQNPDIRREARCEEVPVASASSGGGRLSDVAEAESGARLFSRDVTGRRSIRLCRVRRCSQDASGRTYHRGHVPETLRSHGSMHAGWN
jgi:hypothetical protein